MELLIETMLDEESMTASVKARALDVTEPVTFFFEGECDTVDVVEEEAVKDYYVLCARTWNSVSSPELYSLKAVCGEKEMMVSFGLRNLGLDAMRGFFLNGRRTPLVGRVIPPDTEEKAFLLEAKRSGANAVLSTSSRSEAFYRLCDELGLMVVATESVDSRMAKNHPSIIMWNLPSLDKAVNRQYYAFDKTRPTAFLFSGEEVDHEVYRTSDVVFLPAGKREERKALRKEKPYLITALYGAEEDEAMKKAAMEEDRTIAALF